MCGRCSKKVTPGIDLCGSRGTKPDLLLVKVCILGNPKCRRGPDLTGGMQCRAGFPGILKTFRQKQEPGTRIYSSSYIGLIRSEEHTSELQSLMRNSYAVFRLKKKNKTKK